MCVWVCVLRRLLLYVTTFKFKYSFSWLFFQWWSIITTNLLSFIFYIWLNQIVCSLEVSSKVKFTSSFYSRRRRRRRRRRAKLFRETRQMTTDSFAQLTIQLRRQHGGCCCCCCCCASGGCCVGVIVVGSAVTGEWAMDPGASIAQPPYFPLIFSRWLCLYLCLSLSLTWS